MTIVDYSGDMQTVLSLTNFGMILVKIRTFVVSGHYLIDHQRLSVNGTQRKMNLPYCEHNLRPAHFRTLASIMASTRMREG